MKLLLIMLKQFAQVHLGDTNASLCTCITDMWKKELLTKAERDALQIYVLDNAPRTAGDENPYRWFPGWVKPRLEWLQQEIRKENVDVIITCSNETCGCD